jgi:hypothetical protein
MNLIGALLINKYNHGIALKDIPEIRFIKDVLLKQLGFLAGFFIS